MVETVLFDLDNTLLDFNQAEKNAVSKTLEHFHITPEASILKRYSELNLAQWKLLEQGKISREEVKVRRFQFLFKELGTDTPAREAAYIILWKVQKSCLRICMADTRCIWSPTEH
mgnify:CR=1 FL=1